MKGFDYIIIGAGSAGCVLANRLSADPVNRVLLIEAGGPDKNPLIHMPAGVGKMIANKHAANWAFETEGQPHMNWRKLYWPRGRGWGGSSSINGMIYIRGHARDYDQWRQMGLEGWGFADVLPYFKRSETNENGEDDFHGHEGPLHVSNPALTNHLFRLYIQSGLEAGHPYTKDFNGFQQEGFGFYQLTIKDGQRWSAASAYLRPVLGRPNLTCEVNAHTTRILFEKGRAVGVEYLQKGKLVQARAEREVLLCGGAVNTPQTLLLSGIGDGDYLRKWGIPAVSALKGVGQNLQDHLDVMVHYETTQPVTFHKYLADPVAQIGAGLNYMLFRQGPGRQMPLQSGAFLKSDPSKEIPDLQIHFVAALHIDHGRHKPDRHGVTAHACQLRPESRGYIALKSADPLAEPIIQPNYLATEEDRRAIREAVKIMRDVFAQRAWDAYRGPEINPGAHVRSDAQIDEFVRRTAETIYHPVGTAKMGPDSDPTAVVDAQLRVYGIEGLRVVDASVMPTLIGGNTNAPTIMIAEKASDMILGKPPLAPLVVKVAEDEALATAAE